jgi:hypothetical protein
MIILTILNESVGHLIRLAHEPQVQCSTIADFIIHVIEASGEEDSNAAFDLRVLLTNAKLRQRRDCCSSNDGILKDDTIVDVSDVLGRLRGLRPFQAQEVKNSYG